jgi:hypothetical protein
MTTPDNFLSTNREDAAVVQASLANFEMIA